MLEYRMENKNFMVSEEIANEIDQKQFLEQDEEISDTQEHIIIKLESEDILIPGIITKYDNRFIDSSNEEEISFKFITDSKSLVLFQRNMNDFNSAKLLFGEETIGEYNLNGMNVKRITVEHTPTQTGCVITVVYK